MTRIACQSVAALAALLAAFVAILPVIDRPAAQVVPVIALPPVA